jgi:transposase InsO family protein
LFYGKSGSKRAYLFIRKYACTKQILSYVVSGSLRKNFVLETVEQLIEKHGSQLSKNLIIHSDQGVHYSAYEYMKKLDKKHIKRSMSR